jgi:hypothetical protein
MHSPSCQATPDVFFFLSGFLFCVVLCIFLALDDIPSLHTVGVYLPYFVRFGLLSTREVIKNKRKNLSHRSVPTITVPKHPLYCNETTRVSPSGLSPRGPLPPLLSNRTIQPPIALLRLAARRAPRLNLPAACPVGFPAASPPPRKAAVKAAMVAREGLSCCV